MLKDNLNSTRFGSRLVRHVRWGLLAGGLAAVWACNDRRIAAPSPSPSQVHTDLFQQSVNRNVDIVFEIDNSVSMAPEQANLVANFPAFINILKNLPGGLPDVHIGVVTSDMGAAMFSGEIKGCEVPDNGAFIDQVRSAVDPVCNTARLNAGAHFIQSSNGGTQNNFQGDITDVFRCVAQVGTTGCGFEDHLEAVRAALGDPTGDSRHGIPARAVPAKNSNFLRPDAYLAVILITNEEECSTTPNNVLFDPTNDALGPLQARCFGYTDICDGKRVMDYVQAGKPAGPFQNCVPDETTFDTDPTHAAIPVQFYVDYFKRLKANPQKILLSGIVAPAAPYSITLTPDGNGGMLPLQGNSCTGSAGVFGQATPRLAKFFGAFPSQQVVTTSICDQSFAPAMQLIAEQLGRLIGSPCVSGDILSTMGPHGTRPDCSVVDHTFDTHGNPVDTPLPSCVDNGNQAPCWNLVPGTAAQCSGQQLMQFMRPANAPVATDLNTSVQCSVAVCAPGVHNPPACP